jgi:glycosyltransferase involved in cell wall biosynthesis
MPGDATESNEYFEKYIKPLIDSSNVIYFGEANESQKNELFRRAYFSIVTSGIEDQGFKEPFGRVIAESLMNGCPVLGYIGGGSIIEQVIQGVDGYLFDSIDETSNLIQKIKFLDRKQIAVDARKRLSSDKFIDTMNQILTDAHSK